MFRGAVAHLVEYHNGIVGVVGSKPAGSAQTFSQQKMAIRNCLFNEVHDDQKIVQRCTAFPMGMKGVWWMPWLQRAMKDVIWLR